MYAWVTYLLYASRPYLAAKAAAPTASPPPSSKAELSVLAVECSPFALVGANPFGLPNLTACIAAGITLANLNLRIIVIRDDHRSAYRAPVRNYRFRTATFARQSHASLPSQLIVQ